MTLELNIGSYVRVLSVPQDLPANLRVTFEACVGGTFKVVGAANGFLELEVGEALGEKSYMHSIWIEPAHVSVCDLRDGR